MAALSTAGLLIVAIAGFSAWKTQFLKRRDHDLAVRIVNAVASSYVVFDELRAPHPLFSNSDVPVPPPEGVGSDVWAEHRKMLARYKAKTKHVIVAREKLAAHMKEAVSICDRTLCPNALIELLAPTWDLFVRSLKYFRDVSEVLSQPAISVFIRSMLPRVRLTAEVHLGSRGHAEVFVLRVGLFGFIVRS